MSAKADTPASASATPAFEAWGITGGIASGKSTAAAMFADEGIPVIDADRVARELGQPGGAAHAEILARFGTDDRAELRRIVFGDAGARKELEAILHPRIQQESLRRMEALALAHPRGAPKLRILYEAALLVETGRHRRFTGLIVVDSSPATRRERLIARDGCPPDLADRILSSQIADSERLAAATHVIRNEGSLEDMRTQVRALIARLGWSKG